MQFKGPEHGCPDPEFPNVNLKVEPEQGGIPIGTHRGENSVVNLGQGEAPHEAFGKWLKSLTPRERRALVERHLALARLYDGPGGP